MGRRLGLMCLRRRVDFHDLGTNESRMPSLNVQVGTVILRGKVEVVGNCEQRAVAIEMGVSN